MTTTPVTISRATATTAAALLRHLMETSGEHDYAEWSIAELDAVLTDAAEAAAWEPLRPYLLKYRERDKALESHDRAGLDQLVAKMRETFAQAGMAIDDPTVVRTIIITVSCVVQYGADVVASNVVTPEAYDALCATCHPITLAASRLVPDEVLQP